ncbi:hypothetical protein MIND_00617700 [Mycena indigotica]|uniref:Uncharacterized protein n=1 Tax=Mycena indigotica TaxID=2126181 RepID=A0A8H6SQZ7_9AGAR|nr:uncharacterized protein MIND_00617700 [Mycena indigotica]KAF7303876.1 hypothetical protein MIND_00617700 [Mycena indigotica]
MATALVLRQKLDVVLRLALSGVKMTPVIAKYFTILVFLLNFGSWPLAWHFRVFHYVIPDHLSYRALQIRNIFTRGEKWRLALQDWNERRMAIGVNPFRQVWTYKWSVGIHEGDFLLHMSNSSYGATLDRTRMHLATIVFPTLLRVGGFAPLGAKHYHFIREIPTLSSYEVRATIATWDQKWFYTVFRFVKPVSAKDKKAGKRVDPSPIASTPLPINGNAEPEALMKALAARAATVPEHDGAFLYTDVHQFFFFLLAGVVVNQFCFKVGRITVPPALVFASNGLYVPPDADSAPSATGARPPYWEKVRAFNASTPKLRKLFAGGWRDTPPEDRWWEEAFAHGEDIRKARLELFTGSPDGEKKGGLVGTMEAVREMSRLPVLP